MSTFSPSSSGERSELLRDVNDFRNSSRSDGHFPVVFEFTNRHSSQSGVHVQSHILMKAPQSIIKMAERCLGHKHTEEKMLDYKDISVYICTMGPNNKSSLPLPSTCNRCARGVQLLIWLGRDAGATIVWQNDSATRTQTTELENGGVYIGTL